jgi:transcriptional regulator with XRE-family HTH domain
MTKIRTIRLGLGLTQQQMADALGISRDAYAKYDQGKRETPPWMMAKVNNLRHR